MARVVGIAGGIARSVGTRQRSFARSEDVEPVGSMETLRLIAPVADMQQAQDGDATRSEHRRWDRSISGHPPTQHGDVTRSEHRRWDRSISGHPPP